MNKYNIRKMEFFNHLPILDIQKDWKQNKNFYIYCYVSNGFEPINGLILMKPFINSHKYCYFVCNQLEKHNTSINMLGYNGPNILEELFPKMYQFELDNPDEDLDFYKMYKSSTYKKVYQQIYKHKKHKQFLLFSIRDYGKYFQNKYMKDLIENRDLYNLSIMIIAKDNFLIMKEHLDYALYFNIYSNYLLQRIYNSFTNKELIKDYKTYNDIHSEIRNEYNDKHKYIYFVYKKNDKNHFDFYKYNFDKKEIESLIKKVENNIFRLCNDEVWERNKYVTIKNECFKELLFLFNYKKIFKKFNFDKLNTKDYHKNIFIGTLQKDIYEKFYKIIEQLENTHTYLDIKDDKTHHKLINTIYINGMENNEKELKDKILLPTYILHFKNIHTFNELLKKSYFDTLFHANHTFKTYFYIYQETISKDFFKKKINLSYYSKCMGYMNAFDDHPLYYSNVNYIIINISYIKESMKYMYDELFYLYIPVYKSYEKLINHYSKKYSTIIIHCAKFDEHTYDYNKDINKIIYFY